MYIKTENWRGDDDYDNRGGYRKGKDGDIHNRRRDDRDDRHGHGGRDGRDGRDSRDGYKKSYDGKKDGYKKDFSKGGKKGDFKKKTPYIDPAKLAGLSYEERMKMYKEAYASGSSKSGKNANYKKGDYKKDDYKKNNKNGNNGNNGSYKKGDYKKNSKKSYNKSQTQVQKPAEQKKTFWQKVKSFFGR